MNIMGLISPYLAWRPAGCHEGGRGEGDCGVVGFPLTSFEQRPVEGCMHAPTNGDSATELVIMASMTTCYNVFESAAEVTGYSLFRCATA